MRQELKKSVMPGFKFERELCKLMYSVNYKSTSGIGMRAGKSLGNYSVFVNEGSNPFVECKRG